MKTASVSVTSYNSIRMQNSKQRWNDFRNPNKAELKVRFSLSRCINEFKVIYEYSLFAFFGWALLGICSILLTIHFQLVEYSFYSIFFTIHILALIQFFEHIKKKMDGNSTAVEIVITTLFTIWVFVLTFLFCEPGERVSNQFESFGEELQRCNWYKLSMEMQRLYAIFLLNTQQPIIIESYGQLQCTRETFKRVIISDQLFVWSIFFAMYLFWNSLTILFQVITKGYSYFAALCHIK